MTRNVSNGDDTLYASGRRVSWFGQATRFLVLVSLTPIALVTAGLYTDGKSLAEKLATSVLMPAGFIVFLLIGIGLFAVRNARWALAIGILFIASLAWLATSPIVAMALMGHLESQVQSQLPTSKDPFDVIVVLGGGTGLTPDLRPQLANSGDRIGLATRLYHAGAVKQIVVTGTSFIRMAESVSVEEPHAQSKQLLVESGIKESDIAILSGVNTSEEMKSLKEHSELWKDKRCGLLTSAFHIPRAMRLAKAQGLDLIPVAADYRGGKSEFNLRQIMPSGEASATIELVLKEYLGSLVGR